jgi:hypothetical protein
MEVGYRQSVRRLFEYDALSHRLWIFGQRCHHGATGSVVAAAACVALLSDPDTVVRPVAWPASMLGIACAGGALMMAHDWKDRSMWFERGRGTQV